VIADVFTDVPLEGNALGVFTDASGLTGEQMQRAARELNLSETAFVLPGDDEVDARLRIFTPSTELPFAGHPILGTAVVLGTASGAEIVQLQTGAGVIPVELVRRDGEVVFGEMEQPIPTWEEFPHPAELLTALALECSELPIEAYTNGPKHVYVELADEEAVAGLDPDLAALTRLGEIGVGCFAISGTRVKSRNFAPGLGVPEDPATGSAAGPLAVHLARHGRTRFGQEIEIHQGAEIRRPSLLRARVDGSLERLERVVVGGAVVVVARGEYRLS
jgi:trans-2,3-dihydro-3-hydroxyanthranilate isomerase